MSWQSVTRLAAALSVCAAVALAQTTDAPLTDRERALLQRIDALEQRVAALEHPAAEPVQPAPAASPAAATTTPAAADQKSATGDSASLPGFASGTTFNVLLDGYYEYNFNQPLGRINLLRPYDPTSNSFTINQAVLAVERTPNVAEGRRYGVRLDLMFGQATESLAGNPANEPRTAPYRNIYQAYGTYVFPLGSGLTVDFGRFSSPIGSEGSFAKDQINYTRSFLFTALPFYHLGFRAAYSLNSSTTLTFLLVNGLNQSEDFNGFKSTHIMLSHAFSKTFNWTGGYFEGQENRDLALAPLSNAPPSLPTQPGLSTTPITPTPNGRTHIADTYFTWSATPKLSFTAEGDYIVSRLYQNSYPAHLAGGAGYLKYQIAAPFYIAGRFEYVSDRGGYLSGITQALKEGTFTAAWQPVAGFQTRWEFRHDYSNEPFFLTSTPGLLRRDQNTALLGLLWWFGGKDGSW